jgi:wobble nucleotide-excising tRNase
MASDTEKHGLIIDDPVSSLDHIRLRRVATVRGLALGDCGEGP